MKKWFKKLIFILTIVVLLTTIVSKLSSDKKPSYNVVHPEAFDRDLIHISSLPILDSVVQSFFKNSNQDTLATVNFIDDLLRNRFYHGYSTVSFKSNWVAFLLGKLIWKDFIYLVRPNDIIKHPEAACSQQGIIFQDQLKKLGVPFATIAFHPTEQTKAGHFAISVYYNNQWHFYDSNQEPFIEDKTKRPSVEEITSDKLYEKMYYKEYHKNTQDFFITGNYERINKNEMPGKRMRFVHGITAFLSNWLWLLLALSTFLIYFKKKK